MIEYRVIGLRLPEVKFGDDIADLIVEASREIGGLQDNDVVVVTSKVISKAKGYMISLDKVKPSRKAFRIARVTRKDPKLVQAILDHSEKIVAIIPVAEALRESDFHRRFSRYPEVALKVIEKDPTILLVETCKGELLTDAGIDSSNVPPGYLSYPPPDPDKEAREIREKIKRKTGKRVAVVITDTEFTISRFGSVDIAIGVSGLDPIDRNFASPDLYGKPKYGGVDLIADEIAAAAALLMKQAAEKIPVAIVRGLDYDKREVSIKDILIPSRIIRKTLIKTILTTVKCRILKII